MSPAIVRPLLHTVHLLTFALLFATGLLLLLPTLRAAVTGGYALLIRDTHRWGGVAFVALPLAAGLRFGVGSLFTVPDVWTARAAWQAFHIAVTVLMGVVFTATGIVLWAKRACPLSIVDASHSGHDWLTYTAGVLVAAHLGEVGVAALTGRMRAAMASARRPPS